jgi:hypothetical protein
VVDPDLPNSVGRVVGTHGAVSNFNCARHSVTVGVLLLGVSVSLLDEVGELADGAFPPVGRKD